MTKARSDVRLRPVGWAVSISCLFVVSSAVAQPVWDTMEVRPAPVVQVIQRSAKADFGGTRVAHHVREVADWVIGVGDHRDQPFVVVDKIHARVFVFNKAGYLQGATPALLGLARGDDSVPGMGDRPLSRIHPKERTTPAGRFDATLARNLSDQDILWVDYDQGISLHPVRSVDLKERRLQRLASPSAHDNRISYGCINVPTAFWRDVVMPTFSGTLGVVYVLPEIRPLRSVFTMQ